MINQTQRSDSHAMWTEQSGYVKFYDPTHPLAANKGSVARHRHVMWTAMGCPNPNLPIPCNWCGHELPLRQPEDAPVGHVGQLLCIHADHVNGVKGDDRPENLVPSCMWCNMNRSWAPQVLGLEVWDSLLIEVRDVPPISRPHLPSWYAGERGMTLEEAWLIIKEAQQQEVAA